MIRWAIGLLILAAAAALLGFTPLGGESMYFARNCFYAILVLFIFVAAFTTEGDKPVALR